MWLFPIASVLRRMTMRMMRTFFLSLSIRRGKRSKIHMEITDKIVSKTITQPADLENRFCLIKRDNSISHILAKCATRMMVVHIRYCIHGVVESICDTLGVLSQ